MRSTQAIRNMIDAALRNDQDALDATGAEFVREQRADYRTWYWYSVAASHTAHLLDATPAEIHNLVESLHPANAR